MKVAAAILATLMLFMTAQEPVLSASYALPEEQDAVESSCSPGKTECSKEKPVVPCEEDPGKCCDYDFCNPFGACCPYTPAERPLLAVASFFIQRKVATLFNENIISSYIGDIWQPPETGSLS